MQTTTEYVTTWTNVSANWTSAASAMALALSANGGAMTSPEEAVTVQVTRSMRSVYAVETARQMLTTMESATTKTIALEPSTLVVCAMAQEKSMSVAAQTSP